MFNKKNIFLTIITSFFVTTVVLAVSPSLGKKDYLLEYTMTPEVPQPNQLVTLDIRSYHFDMNSAEVFIYEDNEIVENKTGLRKFIFRAPDGNVKKTITVIVKDIDGKTYRQDIVVRPVEVTLVYEVENAYKPIFYKGKAYPLSNSKVKFKAFADFFDSKGKYINPDNLIYNWYVNFKKDYSSSGYGKKIFTIERLDAYPVETIIQVKVSNMKKDTKGTSALFLNPESPIVDFYEIPVAEPFKYRNIWKDGVLSFNDLSGEIKAVPYFMDNIDNPQYPIFHEWRVNGKKVFKSLIKDLNILEVAVDPESDVRGGEVRYNIENKAGRPFQYVEESFRVEFNENNNNIEESDRIFNKSDKVNIDKSTGIESFFGLF